MKKSKIVFFPVFLLLLSVIFSCLPIAVFTEEAEPLPNCVTLSATQEVIQGETYYGYVYLDNLEEVASLNLSVHYDPAFVTVTSTYNLIPCALYDSSLKNNTLSYSYIFSGDTPTGKNNLFYFTYSVCTDAPTESSYFDIVIDEAYASDLTVAEVSGSRYAFHVNEKKITKTAYIYGTSGISSQKEQEFEINYYFSTTEIASGAVSIQYDKDLFEFVSLTQADFLNGKIADVNSSLAGTVYVSFLGTEYANSTGFLRVKFKTIGNVTEKSQIKLAVSDLYDLELTPISCSGYATSVNLIYDSAYDDSLAKIFLTSTYDAANNQVRMLVKLSANTHLGAGDFALNWDTTYLRVASYEKKFSPTFFNVNDKQTGTGILKFSIISLSDITEATDVLCLTFDVLKPHDETSTGITVSGSGLSDSLTNPICFNFVGCNQTIPGEHKFGEWYQSKTPTCTEKGEERRDCEICDYYETRETDIVSSNHDYAAPTYSWNGDQCTATRICKHDANHVETETVAGQYVKDTDATCLTNEFGHYVATFANSAFTTHSTNVNSVEKANTALEHDYAAYQLTKHDRVEPTFENDGNIEYWTCDECGKYFSDAEGKNEISADDIVIGKLTIKKLTYLDGEVLIEVPSNAVSGKFEITVDKIVPPPTEIVEKIKDTYGESSEVLAYYEIRMFDENGDRIYSLNNEIIVKSKLPEKYQTGYVIKMNQEDDNGNLVEMQSWREGEYICYKTDWMEKY